MIEAQADIALGEAIRPSALAHSKVYSGGLRLIILPALAFAGGIIASTMIGMILPLISLRLQAYVSLLWIAGALLGLMAALRILQRQHLRGYINGLRKLGSPAIFPTRFRFDEDGIAIDSSRHRYQVPWRSVLFVIPAPEHWLVQVDTLTLAVPRRAFSDAAGESAFLELAAQGLGPDAKARSSFVRD
ncbi:MAG TPA: YcxB family protein [Sphingomicrobium sp.]